MNTTVSWGAGYVSPVAPPLIDWVPVPIGKINVVTVDERTGSTYPVAGSVRSVQHRLTALPPRQHDQPPLQALLP
jgi:hypothetical protein